MAKRMHPKVKTTKPRNRAAQDATLINLRALQKRVTAIEEVVTELSNRMSRVSRFLAEQYGKLFTKGGTDPDLYA